MTLTDLFDNPALADPPAKAAGPAKAVPAIDPVCGMEVDPASTEERAEHAGVAHFALRQLAERANEHDHAEHDSDQIWAAVATAGRRNVTGLERQRRRWPPSTSAG